MWWDGLGLAVDERELVALADRVAAAELTALTDADPDGVRHARRAVASCGLWGVNVPEAAGGAGAGYREAQLVLAALARRCPALALAGAHLTAAALALSGDERGPALLRAALAGDDAVAVVDAANADPTAGSPLVHVPRVDACATQPHLVVLRADDHVGLVRAADVEYGPLLERTGLDGALSVPARFRVDAIAELPGRATPVRARWHSAVAAVAAGLATGAADQAVDYAGERVQFGGPLTALPVVRGQLFDQYAQARSCLLATLVPADGPAVAAGLLDRALGTAIATAAAAQQVHGGYGYLAEYPVVRMFRDAVSLQAAADPMLVRAAGSAWLAGSGVPARTR